MNNTISRENLESLLYSKYGFMIKIADNDNTFKMNQSYKFQQFDGYSRLFKEFSCELKDVLYRNYYWIDSAYRKESIYEKFHLEEKGFTKNDKEYYGIEIHMDNGYDIYFVPDYINEKDKEFFHYFDMSYFICPNHPNELFSKIYDIFKEDSEWGLNYSNAEKFEKDYE